MVAEIFKTERQLLVRKPTLKVRFHFRLVGTNGEIVAHSEAYTQKHNVTEVLQKYFPQWDVKDLTR